jgi:hypothetical protein
MDRGMRGVLDQVGKTVQRGARGVTSHLWFLPALGALIIVVYALALESWTVLAISAAIAAAAVAAGSIVGFLFGIPRTLTAEVPAVTGTEGGASGAATIRSNTNLEQISDWLTKIIVGVGLVELGQLRTSMGDLVDYLAPALGDDASAKPFTLSIILYFSIAGFLGSYIVTRLVLQHEFAVAERDIAEVAGRVVREEVQRRDQADATALALITQQLDPKESPVEQEALTKAIAAASQVTRQVIFTRARRQRRDSARDNDALQRTIPVFRALIAADEAGMYHRNHGQLAYALKDQVPPDWAEAEKELSEAIRIRDERGARGFHIYEFNRAICRIVQDPDFAAQQASTPAQRERVVKDLMAAMQSRSVGEIVRDDPRVLQWAPKQDPPVDLTAT